ncbi:FxsA family protein [Alkaliphilus sp. MSJ-5]|uniref:FxsA family protein n=1 Tax=Alkaliphilus flagellatus TaxID=2841507 RepID=A0ABS6FY94_9FIRM|nr:FxsA family protein [Alkaliphilus flagellatus]MBU5675029.1 FxsA family protein [Alkaliphilus flagellatus]
MLFKLILLFTLLPLLDFAILLKIGSYIGFKYTLAIVIVTGLTGAYFAKREGRDIITKIKFDISQGKMPADELIGGLCVILGGAFLLAPGLITDALGLMLVLPITRIPFINMIKRRFKSMLTGGNLWFYFRR